MPAMLPMEPPERKHDASRLPNSNDQLRTHVDDHMHERSTTTAPPVATRTCWLRVRTGNQPGHTHGLCDRAHGAHVHGLLRAERVHLLLVHRNGRSPLSQLRHPI